MRSLLLSLCLILLLNACLQKNKPEGELRKLSKDEMLERYKDKVLPVIDSIRFEDASGNSLNKDSLLNTYKPDSLATDWYVNERGMVKKMIVRKATEEDRQFIEQVNEVLNAALPLTQVEIDCQKLDILLEAIYNSDQEMRKNNGENIDPFVDHQNLSTVVSILEQCGMPTREELSERQINAIWLVLQHGENKYRKKYLPLLEEAAERGDLDNGQIAVMKDRILMNEGKPQIYGSQIIMEEDKFVLYDLRNPETVNKRREEVGLEPLQDYLSNWDIPFEVEQQP